jgi:hypothetical protein
VSTLAPESCADQLQNLFFFVFVFEKKDVRSSDNNEDNFAEGEKKKKKKKKSSLRYKIRACSFVRSFVRSFYEKKEKSQDQVSSTLSPLHFFFVGQTF